MGGGGGEGQEESLLKVVEEKLDKTCENNVRSFVPGHNAVNNYQGSNKCYSQAFSDFTASS